MPNLQPEVDLQSLSYGEIRERKAEIRRLGRRNREQMGGPQRAQAGRAIASHLIQHRCWEAARTVAIYIAVGAEVPTQEIIQEARRVEKRIALPRVERTHEGLSARFCVYQEGEALEPGPMGIPQPAVEAKACPPEEVDLWLVPGLAFDSDGGRVGYGKGLYDAVLQSASESALKAGVAYDCQHFERAPMEERDVRMDALITESGWRAAQKPTTGHYHI